MKTWKQAINTKDIPFDSGGCVSLGNQQIALFHYDKEKWYAVENSCPHGRQFVISRGLIGDHKEEPKVSCPLHKNSFSLRTGEHLGGNPGWKLKTFPVKQVGDQVWVQLDEQEVVYSD